MILFEIKAPDGRLLRQRHESLETLKAGLIAGYEVVGTVFGADGDGKGGMVERPGEPSLMRQLLDAHGDELEAWLAGRAKRSIQADALDATEAFLKKAAGR